MLENRSDDQTIIMTGRQIPEALIPYADAVYEISNDQRILMLMLHRMIGGKKNVNFTGAGVALVTPFKEDLSVDYDQVREIY